MIKRSLSFAVLALLLVSTATAQQTFISEDFSSASGANAPAGWSSITNVGTSGTEMWRFDDPGNRGTPTAMTAPVAVWDDDALSAGGGMSDGELISPPFNATGASTIILQFENKFIELATSTILVEVFDGFAWNVAYTHTTPDIPVAAVIGGPLSEMTTVDITAAAAGAPNAMIRFHWTLGSFDWYWQVDNVSVFEPATGLDVGVSNIVSPTANQGLAQCTPFSTNETVSIDIQNFSFTTLPAGTMIPAQFDVDAGTPTTATFMTTGALAFGQSENFVFPVGADLSLPGPHTVTCATTDPTDLNLANDGMSVVVAPPGGGAASTLPFFENFDTFGAVLNGNAVPTGWLQDPNDGSADWLFENATPPSNNGPGEDHTTGVAGVGFYAYTEDSVSTNSAINLLTPCIDLTSASNPLCTFWFNNNDTANPAQQNDLAIDIEAGGFIIPNVVPSIFGNGGEWTQYQVELSAFAGTIIRVQFRGRDDNNGSSTSINDMGLDDIAVFDFVEGVGQRPQMGLATLDISGATESNGFPVEFGLGGPYFSTIDAAGSADFTMRGVPNMPIVLLGGTLGVGAINFGLVGQLDVINPTVVGDGTSNGFFDAFFILDSTGERQLSFSNAPNLSGMTTAFQAIMLTGTPLVVAFSNAVNVTFM